MTDLILKTAGEIGLERLEQCVELAKNRFTKSVKAVYREDGTRPQAYGTCFFLRFSSRTFMVTAAHVIDDAVGSTIYLGGVTSLIPIEGVFAITSKPGGDRSKDRIDFAFAEVSDSFCEQAGIVAIEEAEISHNRGTQEGRQYLALGFPASRQKTNPNLKLARTTLWSYSGMAKTLPKLAQKLFVSGDNHIFIGHSHKQSMTFDGEVRDSVKVAGVSGGPLFDLGLAHPDNLRSDTPCTAFLAGLLIEKHGDHNAIVALKIGVVVDHLRTHISKY